MGKGYRIVHFDIDDTAALRAFEARFIVRGGTTRIDIIVIEGVNPPA